MTDMATTPRINYDSDPDYTFNNGTFQKTNQDLEQWDPLKSDNKNSAPKDDASPSGKHYQEPILFSTGDLKQQATILRN